MDKHQLVRDGEPIEITGHNELERCNAKKEDHEFKNLIKNVIGSKVRADTKILFIKWITNTLEDPTKINKRNKLQKIF